MITELLDFAAMSEVALLVELGTIEAYKFESIRKSREFWKAVENRNKI